MRSLNLITQLMLVTLLLTSCGQGAGSATIEPAIKIGGLFALSGAGASWGIDEMDAARMAIDEANEGGGVGGTSIEIVIEDSKTISMQSVAGFEKLTSVEGVEAVIGPTWDESTSAIAPIADAKEVVLISPSAGGEVQEPDRHPFLFVTAYPDHSATLRLQEFMDSRGHNRIVVIHNLNAWAQYVKDTFESGMPAYNISSVGEYGLNDDVSDFRTTILRIEKEKPDAVFFVFTTDETIQPFVQQAIESGLDIPLYTASQTESEQTAKWYSDYPNQIFHPFPKRNDRLTEFESRFEESYGRKPSSPSAAPAYDATRLVINALRNGARSGKEIKEALDKAKGIPGVTFETIGFTDKGLIDAGPDVFVIKTVKNGKFAEVDQESNPEWKRIQSPSQTIKR